METITEGAAHAVHLKRLVSVSERMSESSLSRWPRIVGKLDIHLCKYRLMKTVDQEFLGINASIVLVM